MRERRITSEFWAGLVALFSVLGLLTLSGWAIRSCFPTPTYAADYGTPADLDDLDDVDASTPADNDALTYDQASGTWIPEATLSLADIDTLTDQVHGTTVQLTSPTGAEQVLTGSVGSLAHLNPAGLHLFGKTGETPDVTLFHRVDPTGGGLGVTGSGLMHTYGGTIPAPPLSAGGAATRISFSGLFPADMFGAGSPPVDTYDYMDYFDVGGGPSRISFGPHIGPYSFAPLREIWFDDLGNPLAALGSDGGWSGTYCAGLFGAALTVNATGGGIDYTMPLTRGAGGDLLVSDGAGAANWWTPTYIFSLSLDGLSDVAVSGMASGDSLIYNGATWEDGLPRGMKTTNSGWTDILTDDGTHFVHTFTGGSKHVQYKSDYFCLGPDATSLPAWANTMYLYIPQSSVTATTGTHYNTLGFQEVVPSGASSATYNGFVFNSYIDTLNGAFSGSGTGSQFRFNMKGNNNNTSTNLYALNLEMSRQTGTGYSDTVMMPVRFFSRHEAAGTISSQYNTIAQTRVDTGATSSNVRELFFSWDSVCNGTVTDWHRIDIRNLGGTPTSLTTQKGIYIADLNKATTNYGVYVADFTDDANDWGVYNLARTYLGEATHVADAKNIILGTTTGSVVATAANQKLAFWGATPVVQQGAGGVTAVHTSGVGTAVLVDDTFTGNIGATAYTIGDIVAALKTTGIIAQ